MKSWCLLVFLGLCFGLPPAACAADFSFGRPVRLMLARASVSNVAIGDINGDGRDDLAATATVVLPNAMQEVSVFLQGANGVLAEPLRVQVPYAHRGPIVTVDLDGDGAAEVVVGKDMPGMTVVRLSAGALTAVDQGSEQGCYFLAAGDIDGDGHADVVCHDWKDMGWIYYGDGNGGFRSKLRLRTPAGAWDEDLKCLRLADVTGDGRLDLLVTASSINSFFVFPNNGLGAFWPASVYTHPWSPAQTWATTLEVIDVDGDGTSEIVTASPDRQPDAALNVYRRGTNGLFALSRRIPIHDSPTALVAADVDRDGDAELVAGHFSFNEVTLLGNASPGLDNQAHFDLPGFGIDIPLTPRQGSSNGIALGDLNGDGCTDLAGATYSGIQVLYGCRPFKDRLPVSDFDGDGVSDVLWRDHGTGEVHLWQWADLDAWYDCAREHLPIFMCPRYTLHQSWVVQATGDFDGDGNSDVFWRDTASGANQVWDRALFPRATTAVSNLDWQVAGAGDFDGDDRSDLFWRNSRTGDNVVWWKGDPAASKPISGVTDLGWKVVGVGDFDGDARSDLLWRHSVSGKNGIWRSANVGTQQAVTAVPDLQWLVAGVGDFNGDGKDDVVWRHRGTGANSIWLSANSASRMVVASVPDPSVIAAVGDYSGDGRADLLWRNASTGENVIWRSASAQSLQSVAAIDPRVSAVR